MRNKSLIHTKQVRTQSGQTMRLEYYLINDTVLDGCAECYGVEVLARAGSTQSYSGIPYITMLGTRIFSLIDKLARLDVSPEGLYDVGAEWL